MTLTKESLQKKSPTQLAALFNELTVRIGATRSRSERAKLRAQRAAVIVERSVRHLAL